MSDSWTSATDKQLAPMPVGWWADKAMWQFQWGRKQSSVFICHSQDTFAIWETEILSARHWAIIFNMKHQKKMGWNTKEFVILGQTAGCLTA